MNMLEDIYTKWENSVDETLYLDAQIAYAMSYGIATGKLSTDAQEILENMRKESLEALFEALKKRDITLPYLIVSFLNENLKK